MGSQAAKEAAAAEAAALRQEVDRVMARHQERVAQWEAATAHDEEQLHQRRAALEVQTSSSQNTAALCAWSCPLGTDGTHSKTCMLQSCPKMCSSAAWTVYECPGACQSAAQIPKMS